MKSKRLKVMIYILIGVAAAVLLKIIWVACATWNIGSWDGEKGDILKRSDFLAKKIISSPTQLISEMPGFIGRQFQGEWALYSCSMYLKALANISALYPETRADNVVRMDSIISIALSPEIREYDAARWHNQDPLESLDGNNSHISYLSHIAWMIGNYKAVSGDTKYDDIYNKICATMNRRILASPSLNLPTYPGEPVYIPDMLVAIVALNDYAQANGGKYGDTVDKWMSRAKTDWIDPETGLVVAILNSTAVKGAYTALNCYYLALIDADFGAQQYELLKRHFFHGGVLSGVNEFIDRSPILDEDIDAGIIIFGRSPSGTAFAIGSATIYNDQSTRKKLLHTAEIVAHTLPWGPRHYWLSNLALVGEAITLAMRTTCI